MRRIAVGLTGAAIAWSAWSARHGLHDREARCFRRLNGGPGALHVPAWIVMQGGSLGAAFVAGGLAVRTHGRRDGAALATVGVGTWAAVKLVKPLVRRGRPADLLDDVAVRGRPASGLGYPSGHAAVAAALAIARPPGGPAAPIVAGMGAAAVGASRVYVGAHLPLDAIGGWGIGVLAGMVGRISRGRRRPVRACRPLRRGDR